MHRANNGAWGVLEEFMTLTVLEVLNICGEDSRNYKLVITYNLLIHFCASNTTNACQNM